MYPDKIDQGSFFRFFRLHHLFLAVVLMLAAGSPVLADELSYTFGGNANWFSESATTHDGVDAFQSGAISHSQSSWQETTVTGPGAIKFWWKVSSESCCDSLRFSIDGTSQAYINGEVDWQSRAFAVPAGSHALRWTYSTDSSVLSGSNAGWVDQVSFTPGSNLDVTPPVTTATPESGVYAASQSVTLTASEPASIYYTTNSSDPTTSSTQYSSPITISTATVLKFMTVDTAGNYELVQSANYTFDTTPPSTYASPAGSTYTGARNVSLYCSDSGMGCNGTYYCIGSGCSPSTPYNSTIAITASTDLRYYSTDRAGNSEAVKTSTFTITPDTTPPITIPNAPSGTFGGQLFVYFSCSDGNGSGCANTLYCLGTGCTPSTAYSSSFYITTSTDLRFYSQDRSGNSEDVQTFSYEIDQTPPVTTANPPGGSYDSAPLVTLACSDGTGTGCSSTYYCTGGNCSPSIPYNGPVPINDSTVLRYYSADNASNNAAVATQSYVNPGQPKTITVPGMQPTIQSAIDAAYNGDTVLVEPGTYVENINFKGKGITVTSSEGPEATIIDGNKVGSVITFSSGEDLSAELNGFTIRNGASTWQGGGIYIDRASPTVLNNKIFGNSASWGAGIHINSASPLIRNNIITSNNSSSFGGGISITFGAAAQIIENLISGNKSSSGGGISLWAAGASTINGNTIINNTSDDGGGLWSVNQSSATIVQNLIVSNKAATGGGIYGGSNTDSFVNNTIVNNDSNQGASVYIPNAPFENNIVVSGSGQTAIYRSSSYLSNFSHNLVHSPYGNAYAEACPDQNGINGNITADPRLSSPLSGYYGLLADSPAIDAGGSTNTSLPATDLGGMLRVVDGNGDGTAAVDMGAYEFDPTYPIAQLQGIPTDSLTTNELDITVNGTDVVSYRYALDGGVFTSNNIAVATPIDLTGLANGQHSVVVLGKNALGREQLLSSATAATWVVNTETTNLTFTYGGTVPWFVQPQVTRDGIAYQSGAISNNQSSWMETTVTGPGAIRFWWKVSSQQYSDLLMFSLDGTSQTSISGEAYWQNKAFDIPSGSHTLRWTYSAGSYGSAGLNAGWLDQITYEQGNSIDVTPPTTSATPAAGVYGSSRSVTLSCGDSSGSGCSGTFYCLGSGCNPTTPHNGPIIISSATDLRFYSTDTAGNFELLKTATYAFDTIPPSTNTSPSAGVYSGARDVSLYCGDNSMGCAATYYCLGSGCNPITPYSSAIAITTSTDLRYYSVDNGGNNEAVKTSAFTITPDVAPPTTIPNYASGTYSPTWFHLSCYDDAGSDCASTYYCLGTDCTPTTPFNGSFYLYVSTDLRFYSVDRAGNSETIKTASYMIDPNPPTTSPSVGGGIYATSQNVALSCSDGTGSGCEATYYCLDAGCYPSTQYSAPISITSSTYLMYYSRDTVNNHETIRTDRYTVLTAPPSTINVPSDIATIQAAIDAANDGDTVLVAPGTYVENINFKGKAITVASSGGPDVTILDGNREGRVVTFFSGEWNTSALIGFTIRNGITDYSGGGVYIVNSSPTIMNSRVVDNEGCSGAGIYASGGSPIIRGNIISNNSALTNCSNFYGGGICLEWTHSAQVVDNIISENSVTNRHGGGIIINSSEKGLVRGNIIKGNRAVNGLGGGLYVFNSPDTPIIQNLIVNNSARSGGGVFMSDGALLGNNTIANNDASFTFGSGIYVSSNTGQIINNIIVSKSGQSAFYSELIPQMKNNIVFSPSGTHYDGSWPDQNGINGNISADPQLSGATFGYYGLQTGSPAIDAGDNSVSALTATDLNGSPRLTDGTGQGLARVDIGAYEYDPDEPRAVLTDMPTGATRETSAALTVGGPGIVTYRYAIDGGQFTTADTPVSTPITLTGLSGGSHAVAVIGKTLSREQQISSATVAEWTIDTIPTVTTATPAGGTFAAPQTVTLACADGSGSGCAGTFYCLGGDCTPETPYTGPIAVTVPAGLRYYSRDAFGNQEAIKTASYTFVGTISGRVTDSGTGNGIQGVNITAFNAVTGLSLGYGYTDSSGTYQIAGLAGGNYKLRFVGADYIEQWYNGMSDRAAATIVALSAPGAAAGFDVVMVKGGSITGTVTDKDTGAGIQGVHTAAYYAVTGSWVSFGFTDSSGAYRITGLATGNYKLMFDNLNNSSYLDQWYSSKADLSSATPVTVTNASTTNGIDVALLKGGSITGTVTDSVSGAAITGVYVTVIDATTGAWVNSGSTDSSGNYTIVGLAGSYKLRYSTNGYTEQWSGGKADQTAADSVAVTAPNTTAGIDMVLVKGATVTGTVTDKGTGTAIQRVSVVAYNSATDSWAGSGYTDSLGVYSITGLASGSYKLRFSGNSSADYLVQWYSNRDQMSTANTIEVLAPNTVTGIDVTMDKGANIAGTVTDSETGSGIQGVSVTAYKTGNGAWAGSGYTDSTGTYSIARLATGTYKLVFNGNGYVNQWFDGKTSQTLATAVTVTTPNTTANINVALGKAGSISGTVTDRTTGLGIAGSHLYVIDRSTGDWAGSTDTDSNGNYTITGLASGSYRLRIEPAYLSAYLGGWYGGTDDYLCSGTISVTAPNATTGIDAHLDMGGSISGRVTDAATGAGISGLSISLMNTSNQTGMTTSTSNITVDSTGAYIIGGLPSGDYSLRFSARDYIRTTSTTTATMIAPANVAGIDATLAKGGGISGRVTDSTTGEGVYGVLVEAMDALTGAWIGSGTSDYDGAYAVTGLPSGSYGLHYDGRYAGNGYGNGGDQIIDGTVTIQAGSSAASFILRMDSIDVSSTIQTDSSEISAKVLASPVAVSPAEQPTTVPEPIAYPAPSTSSAHSTYPAYTAYTSPLPNPITVVAPAITTDVDFSIVRLGTITGRVTDSTDDGPLDRISVTAYDAVTGAWAGSAITDTDGTYRIGGVPSGSYRLQFTGTGSADGGYLSTWYGSSASTEMVEVAVQAPETASGIDARLVRGGAIAGSVSVNSCPGPRQVSIMAYDAASGQLVGQTWVDTNNVERFTIEALPAGSYKLAIIPGEAGFVRQWYPNKTDVTSAEPVTVTTGTTTSGIRVTLAVGGGSISGKATGNTGFIFVHSPVKLYDWYSGGLVAETSIHPDGSYQLTGLPDSSYKLLFTVNQQERWYRTAGETALASPVVVSGGAAVSGIDLTVASAPDGDLDASGGPASLIDALMALRIAVGLDAATPEILAHGDLAPLVDGVSAPDGRIDVADVLLILRKVISAPVFTAAQ